MFTIVAIELPHLAKYYGMFKRKIYEDCTKHTKGNYNAFCGLPCILVRSGYEYSGN
jgi:hypothetical protein